MHCTDIDKGGQESSSVNSGGSSVEEGQGPTFRAGESRAGEIPLRVNLRFKNLVQEGAVFERNDKKSTPADWYATLLHAEEYLLDLTSGKSVIVQEYVNVSGNEMSRGKEDNGSHGHIVKEPSAYKESDQNELLILKEATTGALFHPSRAVLFMHWFNKKL